MVFLTGHNYLVAAGIVAISASRMTNPKHGLIEALVILLFYAGINILQSYLDIKIPQVHRTKAYCINRKWSNHQAEPFFRALISIDELMSQLRIQGAHKLSQISYATLESNGKSECNQKNLNISPFNEKKH
ncbi:hypothetical protein GCM10020331_010870 [Ectobacillus funiculus]